MSVIRGQAHAIYDQPIGTDLNYLTPRSTHYEETRGDTKYRKCGLGSLKIAPLDRARAGVKIANGSCHSNYVRILHRF